MRGMQVTGIIALIVALIIFYALVTDRWRCVYGFLSCLLDTADVEE
jgi:hypothetical protein